MHSFYLLGRLKGFYHHAALVAGAHTVNCVVLIAGKGISVSAKPAAATGAFKKSVTFSDHGFSLLIPGNAAASIFRMFELCAAARNHLVPALPDACVIYFACSLL